MKIKFLWFFAVAAPLVLAACGTSEEVQEPEAAAHMQQNDTSLEEIIEKSDVFDGLFTIYQDTTDGSTHLAISEDQIGQEYIYFGYTEDGVLPAGHFRGQFRSNEIFKVEKYFDKIQFIVQNTGFYFDEDNALKRASDANISPAVMVSQDIKTHDEEEGVYILESDQIFLQEILQQIKPSPMPGGSPMSFDLGNLNSSRTMYRDIRSYPKNTDIVVDYVYNNPMPSSGGTRAVTDPRYVTITVQHSFIEVPENDFQPRFEDPRIGYFTEMVDDQTDLSATPYRDMINRWNLQPEDPDAEISEPKEPIVWWIENTTPEELRESIKEGVLAWNESFEQAGFENAVEVKVQPDDADWDAGDIRYNVIRFTSSPNPPFAGYGPSFTNPRTGEIIGANVMLEYTFVRRHLNEARLFDTAGLDMLHEVDEEESMHADPHTCSFGHDMQQNMMTGMAMIQAMNLGEAAEERLIDEAMRMLTLHEVGHTIGLNHNMKASILHPPEDIYQRDITNEYGLTGSVMDYSVVNVSPDPDQETQFFDIRPGIYDNWAVEYGYSVGYDDEEAEAARLMEIASRSNEWGKDFGNDADDMRAPGRGIDPRVMTWDLSSDAITYSTDRMELVRSTREELMDRYIKEGQSYQELRNMYLVLSNQQSRAATVISRYVGGVYVDRSFPEQETDLKPYTPVDREDQERAMRALNDNLFAPDAFDAPDELYSYLQQHRRGFTLGGSTEDPKIHDRALNIQRGVLAHLLHPTVTKRLTDSRHYGNEYALADMMGDLTDGIFEADMNTDVNIFRQNLQTDYVTQLASILDENMYDYHTQSIARHNLRSIKDQLESRPQANVETNAHTDNLIHKISDILDD